MERGGGGEKGWWGWKEVVVVKRGGGGEKGWWWKGVVVEREVLSSLASNR